ncbi:MAG TPA: LCP family protein [Gaiellaceae bacterium]|nr:LCP family protein [Gaiellaceae bacterium]
MRTTLKRAQGLSAAPGGGGSVVLPPDALSPVTVYAAPGPRRRSGMGLVARALGIVTAGLLMLVVSLVGGVYLWLHESVAAVSAHSADVKEAQTTLDGVPPADKAAIALVIGYDRRHGEAEGTPSRSDTLMLLRADPQTDTISMLSFPRDLVVPIRCPDQVFTSKINAAYSTCGARGALDTVRDLTGLPINYLITVNFRGFKKIVNTLGGVWVDVDRRYFNDNAGVSAGYGFAKINLQPGYQRLTGGAALDFVRYRHTDSDFHRVARQQLFVTAMKEQFGRSFSITKIPPLVGAITKNVEVGVGGGKDVTARTILRYALFAYGLQGGHFFQEKIEGVTGYSELTTDSSNIQDAVARFSSPDVEAPKVATAVALKRKLKTATPKPEDTTVTVLNGYVVPGAAAEARYLLGQRGYATIDGPPGATGNAPWDDQFHTKVYFDGGSSRARAAATAMARLFGAADTEPFAAAKKCTGAPLRQPRSCLVRPLGNGATVTVVVGQTFHNQLAPAPARTQIVRTPPDVRRDRPATASLVRAQKRKVDFALMVPSVLDRLSYPDSEVPVRTYRMDGHDAVRLVFRRGLEYWGVQQTSWEDAPVLDSRSLHRVINGRGYDFYYHGRKLHMIVLRKGDASYWVVNTLLDSLSNETMIAIAKGLQPLDPPKKAKKAKAKQANAKQGNS